MFKYNLYVSIDSNQRELHKISTGEEITNVNPENASLNDKSPKLFMLRTLGVGQRVWEEMLSLFTKTNLSLPI